MTARRLIQESLNFFSSRSIFFYLKVKNYNEAALRCFAATLLCRVTVNKLLMTPEIHHISKKKSYKDWRKQTPYPYINRNFSAFIAQPLTWKLFLIFTLMDSVLVSPSFTSQVSSPQCKVPVLALP